VDTERFAAHLPERRGGFLPVFEPPDADQTEDRLPPALTKTTDGHDRPDGA